MINSMTGFARAEGSLGAYSWSWEVKSVNAKGLDLRCRLAPGTDMLEGAVRDRIAAKLKRGAITANLALTRVGGAEQLMINEAALEQVLALQERLAGRVEAGLPRLEGLLAVRGLVEAVEARDGEAVAGERDKAILAPLDETLARLVAMRRSEGQRLALVLREQAEAVRTLAAGAREMSAAQPEKLRQRLLEALKLLADQRPPLPEERIAQEVAMLAARADVREEIDRLQAHCEAVLEALAKGGVAGRRLDFLSQELNREANTLCSKSSDVELTRVGLDLKTAIDQFREQVQNVE